MARLILDSGAVVTGKRYPLPVLGMIQITKVVRDLGIGDVVDGRLAISTPTSGGLFGAYASVIDNVTNDPRTRRVLEVTGLDRVLLTYATLHDALSDLIPGHAAAAAAGG